MPSLLSSPKRIKSLEIFDKARIALRASPGAPDTMARCSPTRTSVDRNDAVAGIEPVAKSFALHVEIPDIQ